ncbi:deoxyhypusine synthase family protein [Candidatus Woesearchaeota archaeon]|nr:deoxyhypusine synthase family protein [Candidatus Woesearchaeota archaeon]
MEYVKDIKWKTGISLQDFTQNLGSVGFQSIELVRAGEAMAKMKREGAKIFLTFTSNMVTSGLRGLFAQLVQLKMAHVIVTTVGGIEEDIMRSKGEKFIIGSFHSDDVSNHEKGLNRVGNLFITNESYSNFEDMMRPMLEKIYAKKKRISVNELIHELGLLIDDEDSIIYQAAKNNVQIFCPAITDGALGFHLHLFQQKHPDFIVDIIQDFKNLVGCTSFDEKKGLIALGGGVSKHHAILGALLNGGFDYAVYMTTARPSSGSMSGATTQEAKSWGKIKDDSDAATVIGDVSVFFPLAIMHALEVLHKEGIITSE